MHDFFDFYVVTAKPELYDHCRGFGAVGLPKCEARPRHHLFGLRALGSVLFCDLNPDRKR